MKTTAHVLKGSSVMWTSSHFKKKHSRIADIHKLLSYLFKNQIFQYGILRYFQPISRRSISL